MSEEVNPYASPAVEETLSPGAQWVASGEPALRTVGIGMALIYFGIVILLLTIIALSGALLLGGRANLAVVNTILISARIGILVGLVMMFIGPLFCLAVPSESGAKGLIIASVALQLIGMVLLGVGYLKPLYLLQISYGIGMASLVSVILFLIFLRQLSTYIGRPDLAKRALRVLICDVLLMIFGSGRFAIAIMSLLLLNWMLLLVYTLGIIIFGLIVFIMYANLINELRKALLPKMA